MRRHEDLARRYRGPASARLVLRVLAERADARSLAWPSIGRLIDDTGLSRSTVQRALRELASEGLVEPLRRSRPDGSDASSLYALDLAALAAAPEDASAAGDVAGAGGVTLTGGGVTMTPLATLEPTTDPSDEPYGPSDSEKTIGRATSNLAFVRPIEAHRLERLLEAAARAPPRPPPELAAAMARPGGARDPGAQRTRLAGDWRPAPPDLAAAEGLGLTDAEIADAVAQFRERWTGLRGAGAYRADWSAEWRGWARIFAALLHRSPSGGPHDPHPRPSRFEQRMAGAFAAAQRVADEYRARAGPGG